MGIYDEMHKRKLAKEIVHAEFDLEKRGMNMKVEIHASGNAIMHLMAHLMLQITGGNPERVAMAMADLVVLTADMNAKNKRDNEDD